MTKPLRKLRPGSVSLLVSNRVLNQADARVWQLVWDQVRDQVWDRVSDQLWDRVFLSFERYHDQTST